MLELEPDSASSDHIVPAFNAETSPCLMAAESITLSGRAQPPPQRHGRLALTLVGELRVTAPGRARLTPQRTVLAAEAAAACLIGTDGAEKVNLAKGRPQHVRKVELTVHALP